MKTSKKPKLKIVNTQQSNSKLSEKKILKKDLTRGANLILLNSNCLKKVA